MTRWSGWIPLVLYFAVYFTTCLIGSILLLLRYGPFVSLYIYFSGTPVPRLRGDNLRIELVLLITAPLLLTAGYAVGTRLRMWQFPAGALASRAPSRLPLLLFGVALVWVIVDLGHAGTLTRLSSWFSYGHWVVERQRVFSHIGFFGFVNIYLWLPVTAAWSSIVLELQLGRRKLAVLPPVIAVAAELLLFQKKAAVAALVLIGAIAVLGRPAATRARRRTLVLALTATVAVTYFTLVVIPVWSSTSQVVSSAAPSATAPPMPPAEAPGARTPSLLRSIQRHRRLAVALYAVLAPVTRTAAPTLFYPLVFPSQHPYYGLDLGQDVLGIGAAPDDNTVVWHAMNPTIAGTSAAPFQWVLFSQVGWLWTLALSALLGVLLALFWRGARSERIDPTYSALLGGLVLLFAVYVAIDSLRNSVIVSYGVGWGVLLVFGAACVATLITRVQRRRAEHAPNATR
jgi:hypothetical protein